MLESNKLFDFVPFPTYLRGCFQNWRSIRKKQIQLSKKSL